MEAEEVDMYQEEDEEAAADQDVGQHEGGRRTTGKGDGPAADDDGYDGEEQYEGYDDPDAGDT